MVDFVRGFLGGVCFVLNYPSKNEGTCYVSICYYIQLIFFTEKY